MKKNELASRLNGIDIHDLPSELDSEAKRAGLVVVLGVSADTIEFHGAISDEIDLPGGGTIFFDAGGILPDVDNVPEAERQGYYDRKRFAYTIGVEWQRNGFKWTFTTVAPSARFVALNDGERYTRGVVFSVADLNLQ